MKQYLLWNVLRFEKLLPRCWGTDTLFLSQPKSWDMQSPPVLRVVASIRYLEIDRKTNITGIGLQCVCNQRCRVCRTYQPWAVVKVGGCLAKPAPAWAPQPLLRYEPATWPKTIITGCLEQQLVFKAPKCTKTNFFRGSVLDRLAWPPPLLMQTTFIFVSSFVQSIKVYY